MSQYNNNSKIKSNNIVSLRKILLLLSGCITCVQKGVINRMILINQNIYAAVVNFRNVVRSMAEMTSGN